MSQLATPRKYQLLRGRHTGRDATRDGAENSWQAPAVIETTDDLLALNSRDTSMSPKFAPVIEREPETVEALKARIEGDQKKLRELEFSSMTDVQLREWAEEHEIEGASTKTRQQILDSVRG